KGTHKGTHKDDLSSHTTKYISPILTQKVFANMRRIGKGFSGIETPLFDTMLVQPQVQDAAEVDAEDVDDEIVNLKQRVKKLEKKRRSKSSGLKRRMHPNRGKRAELDVDEDVTLVDVDTTVEMDPDIQGRMKEDVTTVKEINVVEPEPTVFNDEEMQEKHLDNIKKYQSLKRKQISVAQARKNMIVYLKNMVGYKIQHFKGMTYDQVRPIFEREYNNVQTCLKTDRDEEPTKKIVAKETLLQESFKKLRVEVEVSRSHSTQEETPTVDPQEMSEEDVKNMLQIVPVAKFKAKALQVKYPLIDWEIYSEGSRTH
nr:hypothetical protein [Tanacetum cinerariifolium]